DRMHAKLALLARAHPFRPDIAEQTVGEQAEAIGLARRDLRGDRFGAVARLDQREPVLSGRQVGVDGPARRRAHDQALRLARDLHQDIGQRDIALLTDITYEHRFLPLPGTERTRLGGASRRASSRTHPYGKAASSYAAECDTKGQASSEDSVREDGWPQALQTGTFSTRPIPPGSARSSPHPVPRRGRAARRAAPARRQAAEALSGDRCRSKTAR